MALQNSPPLNQGMLYRPRLQALIHKGLHYPVLVMLAGPGYGKTQAMAAYLAKENVDALWFQFGSLDNLPTHFWNHLIQLLKYNFPNLSAHLQTQEFPDTLPAFDVFVQLLTRELNGLKRTIWVFDDFGEITDQRIKAFFRLLVEADLENFHLALMSNVVTSTDSIAFMTDKQFLILGKDLRFTRAEIAELYRAHDIQLEESELNDIERYTEGWPFPLHLLVLQHDGTPVSIGQDEWPAHDAVFRMFEERFFASYPENRQKLFVKLSLLDSFTKELAYDLYRSHEGSAFDLETLVNHMFIAKEPATGRLSCHHLYRTFLQKKRTLLNAEEEHHVLRKAAEYYTSSGYIMEAIACYRKCGDHKNMLDVMSVAIRLQYGTSAADATYFLEYLDLLTAEEVRQYPIADYLRALIYLNTLKLESAEALLLDLELRLLPDETPEGRALLGEAYALRGALHLMNNQEDFGDYYRKAADYLPEGSFLQDKNKLLIRNNHSFAMTDNLPGARERMERAVHCGVPWMSRVLCGGMSGMEHLFSAEAAYLSHQFADAQQHAYRAIYKGEANAQHGIVCNGHCILARIGLIQGKFTEMSKQIRDVVDYAEKYEFGVLKEIRDTALGWYYVKMQDYKRIPRSVIAADNRSDRPLLEHHGRLKILHANYLIHAGEYAKLIGMLEYPTGLHLTRGIWADRICLYIMLAIGYHQLGNANSAIRALWTAYDLSYHNGLTTLFVEAERYMIPLIDQARRQDAYAFAPEWLDFVQQEAVSFAKRAAKVRAAYKKQNPAKLAGDNPLTKREVEVLRALSQGLTREEIAVKQFVSINTVKSFIRNIYNKLGAANRTEAISIAISNEYIEFPASE